MNCRTYEQYNEDEYFLKYLAIHPWILYSNQPNDFNKKQFQIFLLDKFNKEIITYDELRDKYSTIMNAEKQNKQLLSELHYKHKLIEDKCEEFNNNNLNNLYKLLMK